MSATSGLHHAHDTVALRVSGDDARAFLHAQFSADLSALEVGDARLTAWLSPKGRVLFLPRVLRAADGYYLLLPREQAAAFLKRLRLFVLRAKVHIGEDTARAVLVIHGGTSSELPATVAAARGPQGALYVVGEEHALAALAGAQGAPTLDDNQACLAALRVGEAVLPHALGDQFLPQELNLDLTAGLSFDKGCYPGQEIVARVRYRGTVKRRARRWALRGDTVPPAGTRLLRADGAPCGTVLAAARAEDGVELLAVTDLEVSSPLLDDATRSVLAALPLPYPAGA